MRSLETCTYIEPRIIDSNSFDIANFQKMPDYRQHKSNVPWSKYINVLKYNRKRGDLTIADRG